MSWDTAFLFAGGLSLFQAFLSLLIGRIFVRNGRQGRALETLWFVLVAVVFGLGFAVVAVEMQLNKLKQDVEYFQDKLDKLSSG